MRTLIARYVEDESGATAIEYGLIATFVAIAAIVGIRALGTQVDVTFDNVAGSF